MDNSGEVADLMVKESIQLTEAAVKMLAAGSKNLAAFLMALTQNNKKLYGKANMARLLQTGRELKTFHIKESDLEDFRAYAKKNVLFSVIKDTRSTSGIVDLVTKCGLCAAGQPLPGTEELPGPRPGTGGRSAKKSRPPRSARTLLTTAREWLDSQADEEYGYEDDGDY